MTYNAYLQGSYPNATNIRGNSDVDVVVESTAVFYSNLTDAEKQAKALEPGAFKWSDFREEVERALVGYYGRASVTSGDKSIKLAAGGNRLPADVVPAVEYQEYENGNLAATGMTFWPRQSNDQIINFPKLHLENGAAKNTSARTNGLYKPAVRLFKNAREAIIGSNQERRKRYPSYFVECLLSNVDDTAFGNSLGQMYVAVVNELRSKLMASPHVFVCQNGRRTLFGPSPTQWNVSHATSFVAELTALWNEW
jgi:hypothetical protein